MDTEALAGMTVDEKLQRLDTLASWSAEHRKVCRALGADPDHRVRAKALAGFWEFAEEDDLDRLCDTVRTDPAPEVRATACAVLGRFVYEGAVLKELPEERFSAIRDLLINCFDAGSEDARVRARSLESLAFDESDDVMRRIEQAYQAEELELVVAAILSMGRSGDPAWAHTLLSELDSPSPLMRLAAIQATGESRLAQATPRLIRIAGHSSGDERALAFWSLGYIGGATAEAALHGFSASSDPQIQKLAQEAQKESTSMVDVEKELDAIWDDEDPESEDEEWDDEDDDWDDEDWDDDDDDEVTDDPEEEGALEDADDLDDEEWEDDEDWEDEESEDEEED